MNSFRLRLGNESSLTVWPVRVGQPTLAGVDGLYKMANGCERPLLDRFKLRREPDLGFAWLLDLPLADAVPPAAFYADFIDARVSGGPLTPAAFAFVVPATNAIVRDMFEPGDEPAGASTTMNAPSPLIATTSRCVGYFQTTIEMDANLENPVRTLFFHLTVYSTPSAKVLATRSFLIPDAVATVAAPRGSDPSDAARAASEKKLTTRIGRIGFLPIGH